MSESLSVDVVRHVADLARLEVPEDELERFRGQLDAITGHFADIAALDLDGVEPTTHAQPVTNVLRDDIVRPSLDRDVALSQAPEAEDGRFAVPRILGEEP